MISPARNPPDLSLSFFNSRSRPKPASEANTTPASIRATARQTVNPAVDVRSGAFWNSPDPLKIIGVIAPTDTPSPARIAPVSATPIRT